MNNDWLSAEDEVLIKFVRVHELLYNVKHKHYRKTAMKQKLWSEAGNILNKTGSDCYKRWCYVRDYYIRRKGPGFKSSREASKKRSRLLSFLDKFPSSQRNSITNVVEDEGSRESTEEKISFADDPPIDQKTKYITTAYEEDSNTVVNKNENSADSEHINEEKVFKAFNMRNLKRISDPQTQERLNLFEQNAQRNPPTHSDLDENDLFFSSMAKIVKKLPRYEQAQLRMQIGSLVGNTELRFIPIDAQKPNTSGGDYSDTATPSPRPNTASAPTDFLEINIASPPPNSAATNYSDTTIPSRKSKHNFNK